MFFSPDSLFSFHGKFSESLEKEGYTSEASMFKIQPSNLRDFGMSSNLAKITVENIRAAIPSPHPKMEVDEEERDEREDGREEKKKKKGGEDCVEMIPHQYFPKKCRNCFQPLSTHPKVKKASGSFSFLFCFCFVFVLFCFCFV